MSRQPGSSRSETSSIELTGSLAALAATLIWSGNFIVARGMAEAVPPATLAFCRWSVACLALAPLAARPLWRERRLVRSHLGYLLVTSLLGVTLFNTLIYVAGHHTASVNLALISTFIPAFMLLLARLFLADPLTPPRVAGLLCAVFGVVLLLTGANLDVLLALSFNSGDLWMLLAALLFAAYSILVRKKPPELGRTTLLGASFGLGLVMLAPWMITEQLLGLPTQMSPRLLGSILYIGLGASLASYWLWNMALERIGPARAGFIYYTLPLFCAVEATLLLDEPVTWVHAASGLLIIGGIFLASRERKQD